MVHFQSKENIIDWLIDNCPRPAIARALDQGKVEYLGGFSLIPPSILPGWILKVTSLHNKKWNVAIVANDNKHCYGIRIIKSVPWKNWAGITFWNNNRLREKLFSGDNPEKYKELRDAEKDRL